MKKTLKLKRFDCALLHPTLKQRSILFFASCFLPVLGEPRAPHYTIQLDERVELEDESEVVK